MNADLPMCKYSCLWVFVYMYVHVYVWSGYGFVSLFLHVRVLALVKLWGVILFVCICVPPGLFMALSVCVCVCGVCVAYNLCMWECCAFVFVCFLPVATCKDRLCIFFCLGLCLIVSLYVRFHWCFFLVNKVED